MNPDPHKILIIGPSWVGDMVMAQSLMQTLKQRHPDCRIDVLAPSWTLPLLERMPEVNHALGIKIGHGEFRLYDRIKIGRKLKKRQYDQAFVLPNSWKSALIPYFADIHYRTGYLGEMRWRLLNDVHRLDKKRLTKTVERFVALAYPKSAKHIPVCPTPSLSSSQQQQTSIANSFGIDTNRPMLALCPGAEYGPAKRWPAGHFADIAMQKHREGWQVYLFGSVKDQEYAESINYLTNDICINLTGKTQLHEVIDLLALASVVVSNDSGLMHIAAALDKKLIAIYGSSDPGFTPPLHDQATILYLNLPCSPCFKRVCPLKHNRCLTEITPERVLAAIDA